MKRETATQAKIHFGEILDYSKNEPVIIEKSGRDVAVLISFEEYKRLATLEDKYWISKAKKAHKEGFVGTNKSEKLLDDLLNAED